MFCCCPKNDESARLATSKDQIVNASIKDCVQKVIAIGCIAATILATVVVGFVTMAFPPVFFTAMIGMGITALALIGMLIYDRCVEK